MKHYIKKIAITGGIGSGKSFVLQILRELGEVCFSCDEISKELWKTPDYLKELSELFPSACINGCVDKKLLSALVFADSEELEKLNSFAHPKIMSRLFDKMEKKATNRVFAEVPLLFESGYEKDFDKIIVVMREKNERIAAVMKRDNCSLQAVEDKMAAQFNYDLADFNNPKYIIIKNELSFEELRESVQKIAQNI